MTSRETPFSADEEGDKLVLVEVTEGGWRFPYEGGSGKSEWERRFAGNRRFFFPRFEGLVIADGLAFFLGFFGFISDVSLS